MCYLQRMHFRFKDTNRLQIKGWRKIKYRNNNHKRAVLISDKIDFKTKKC